MSDETKCECEDSEPFYCTTHNSGWSVANTKCFAALGYHEPKPEPTDFVINVKVKVDDSELEALLKQFRNQSGSMACVFQNERSIKEHLLTTRGVKHSYEDSKELLDLLLPTLDDKVLSLYSETARDDETNCIHGANYWKLRALKAEAMV